MLPSIAVTPGSFCFILGTGSVWRVKWKGIVLYPLDRVLLTEDGPSIGEVIGWRTTVCQAVQHD
jgi:hypothetical protein